MDSNLYTFGHTYLDIDGDLYLHADVNIHAFVYFYVDPDLDPDL